MLVALSLLFVVIAADRPSLFAATTHAGFFPGWMAGPLGGLWPGLTRDGTTLRWMFTSGLAVMYVCYLLALCHVPHMRGGARAGRSPRWWRCTRSSSWRRRCH